MLARPLAHTLIALTLVALPVAAFPLPLFDDAGSGADAGDSPAEATPVPYGRFFGNTTLDDPGDWYALEAPSALSCVDVGVLSTHALSVTLTTGPRATLTRALDDEGFARHVLAVAPGASARLGLVPDDLFDGALALGAYEVDAALVGATLVDGPARDVSGSLTTPRMVADPCLGGTFKSDGPDADVYGITVRAGERIDYSLSSTGDVGELQLYLPNLTEAQASLLSGGASSFVAPVDGTYLLEATGPSLSKDQSYSLAILVGPDPPGSGCRPYCLG